VRTEIVDDAGHAPQVEQPDAVATLLDAFSVDPEPAAPRTTRERGERDKPTGNDDRGPRTKKEREQ